MYVVYYDLPGGGANFAQLYMDVVAARTAMQDFAQDTECFGDDAVIMLPTGKELRDLKPGQTLRAAYYIGPKPHTYWYVMRVE